MASGEIIVTDVDTFISGESDIVTKPVTISSGNNLAKLVVVGQISVSGKYIPSLPAASDGSQVPAAITAEAVDASAADTSCPVYVGGVFNPELLVWDAAVTAAQKLTAFAGSNIALVTPKSGG